MALLEEIIEEMIEVIVTKVIEEAIEVVSIGIIIMIVMVETEDLNLDNIIKTTTEVAIEVVTEIQINLIISESLIIIEISTNLTQITCLMTMKIC